MGQSFSKNTTGWIIVISICMSWKWSFVDKDMRIGFSAKKLACVVKAL